MADKIAGHGTKLKMNGTPISQRTSIGGPNMEVGERQVDDLDVAYNLFRPGLPNLGEVSLELHWDPAEATHELLTNRVLAPKRGNPDHDDEFILELANGDATTTPPTPGTTITFKGWVKGFTPGGMEPEGTVTGSVTIKVTSIPVIA